MRILIFNCKADEEELDNVMDNKLKGSFKNKKWQCQTPQVKLNNDWKACTGLGSWWARGDFHQNDCIGFL